MEKKWKQQKHVRRVRTKKGKRSVLVNKDVVKKKPVKIKRKPLKQNVVISPNERKLFEVMKQPSFDKEQGGGIGFDHKENVKFISVLTGDYDEISLPADYQVIYHTHPGRTNYPPSPLDVVEFLKNPNQNADLIFAKDDTYILVKTNKKPNMKGLSKKLEDKYDELSGKPGWKEDWIKFVEDEAGIKIKIDKDPSKKLTVPLFPIKEKKNVKRGSG